MALWVWVTIGAAISQTIRSALQKDLKSSLGDLGASLVRFSYAIPFAWLWIWGYGTYAGVGLPVFHNTFFYWVVVAGIMQMVFTILLVTMFSHRSFAAGTAFSKTEVIQAALFEALIIGYIVNLQVGIAIIIGVVAVFLLSLAKSSLTLANLTSSLMSRQTVIGLASGATLGFSTVAYRAATDSLEGSDLLMRASLTGAVAVVMQTVIMAAWMWTRARQQLVNTFIHWRRCMWVGLAGAVSTACWFYAFSAHAVAPVRAVGQIELLFVLGISYFYFREKPTWQELLAMLLLAISIVMVLLG